MSSMGISLLNKFNAQTIWNFKTETVYIQVAANNEEGLTEQVIDSQRHLFPLVTVALTFLLTCNVCGLTFSILT